MNRKMLINATQSNEIRVALIDNNILFDLEIESKNREQKKGNIYKGIVTRIESSLDAVFINYGANKDGFLPFKEISKEYLEKKTDSQDEYTKNCITKGENIIVQIDKEERKNKGAALTTYISLAGCYLVLMPNNPNVEGISRHIDGEDRFDLKEKLNNINIPEGMGVIVRTAGIGKSIKDLEWELDILISQFKAIKKLAIENQSPYLIHQESNLVTRAIRDYLRPNVSEILIDEVNFFNTINKYLSIIRPDFLNKVKLYEDDIPIFSKYKIEHQIELAFKKEIYLPSGGLIVIDNTEALISIDVNSAKSTKCIDIEETALKTNLEAINEISRQLRIRDLGGLIVIDFIDMNNNANKKLVERSLKDALSIDRARVQTSKISKFGLLEMSRQRLRPSLSEYNENLCSKCNGTGKINDLDAVCSNILKVIEEESCNNNVNQINVELTLELANYLMNVKRNSILNIEKLRNVKIFILSNKYLDLLDYKIFKIKTNKNNKTHMPKNQNIEKQNSIEIINYYETYSKTLKFLWKFIINVN